MADEGLSVQLVCRVLDISESGYYDRKTRAPSARSIRHAWLTDLISVHAAGEGLRPSAVYGKCWRLLRQRDDRVLLVPHAGRVAQHQAVETRVELANAIFDYLEIWHNRRRRHSQLGMLSPIEFERSQSITVA